MIRQLTVRNFKSFEEAALELGPITTVIGSNAAGKSNLRDALKFLHGVARGYTLAEIFGGKTAFGGKVWEGIRGGVNGAARYGEKSFSMALDFSFRDLAVGRLHEAVYSITVEMTPRGPLVRRERLYDRGQRLFEAEPGPDAKLLTVQIARGGDPEAGYRKVLPSHQPVLAQIAEDSEFRTDPAAQWLVTVISQTRELLGAMRFLDFDPKQMRQPSVPGEKTISEIGDNLSSVLKTIRDEPCLEESMVSWINALTPMDVKRVEFDEFPDGRILATLVEDKVRRVSLASASDGTLRFLGILAALFSPEPPSLLCFEEIETGFHPVRLALVLNLLEARTKRQPLQVLATTHSPQFLRYLQRDHLEHVYVAYRLEGVVQTKLKRLKALPHFEEVLQKLDLARMHESDWIESTLFFEEGAPVSIEMESGEPEVAPE